MSTEAGDDHKAIPRTKYTGSSEKRMKWHQTITLICAISCSLPWTANGQTTTIYRCGNAFSAVPCGEGEKKVFESNGIPDRSEAEYRERVALMKVMCREETMKRPAWKDTDSLKISEFEKKGFNAGTGPTYHATVNAKNSFGAYTGPMRVICHANSMNNRVLKLEIEEREPVSRMRSFP